MIKTTRLKTSQVPKNITYDLTPQVDGVKQTFELPEKVYDLDQHYVLFNGQVYRNDGNHTFYTISADGMELTTLFDEAPRPGASYVLQFVKTESSEGENAVTKDYVDNKFQEKLTAGTGITIDNDNVISASGATYTAGANITIDADNVISATDTTYNNFVGTDGVDAGVAGLVPAPATTDAGKFLKADGTWDTVGGGIDPNTTFWGRSVVNGAVDGSIAITKGSTAYVMFEPTNSTDGAAVVIRGNGSIEMAYLKKVGTTWSVDNTYFSSSKSEFKAKPIISQWANNPIMPTDAKHYTCKAYVDQVGNTLSPAAPTTATIGVLGQLYTDTTNMHTYQLTAIDTTDPDNPSYTWTQRW